MYSLKQIETVVNICAIFHNMIESKKGYEGTKNYRMVLEGTEARARLIVLQDMLSASTKREQSDQWRQKLGGVNSAQEHGALPEQLKNRIWSLCGDVDLDDEDNFD